jgi:hypothetical protein
MPKRHRKMKGGFLDSLSTWASDTWNKTKSASQSAYSSATGMPSLSSTYTPTTTSSYFPSTTSSYVPSTTSSYVPSTTSSYNYGMGGRKTKRHKKMRGGFKDNTPITGLAANASPISDIKTAQPHNLVGGRRKTRKHKHSRSHRRH